MFRSLFSHPLILKLFKFSMVGTAGLVVDFSITGLLREILLINSFVASGSGFLFATLANYYLNSLWTFSEAGSANAKQFFYFLIISLVGLAMHLYLLKVYQELHFTFYWSKLLAIGCVLVWNFGANSLFTFRQNNQPVN